MPFKATSFRTITLSLLAVLAVAACQATQPVPAQNSLAQSDTTRFRCGDAYIYASTDTHNRMTLELNQRPHRLLPVTAASGAKYETAPTMLPRISFWNKGETATLKVNNKKTQTCQRIVAPDAEQAKLLGPLTPIVNTEWAVEEINGKAAIGYPALVLTLGDNGRVTGFAGCNRFSGAYQLVDDTLHFPQPMIATRMACTSPTMTEQEQRYTSLLLNMTNARVSTTGALWLTNEHGDSIRLKVAPKVAS